MDRLILYKGSLLIAAGIFLLISMLLAGCGAGNMSEITDGLPAGTMLIDYYYRTTAADDGYSEMVLSTTEDTNILKLAVYNKADETASEQCIEFSVPLETAQECYALIEASGMKQWNDIEDTVSTDGTLTVCKFYDNGEYIRVSSDKMPVNGEETLAGIANVMTKHIPSEDSADIPQVEV